MAKQTISIGSASNDHTGDTLRVAFDKVNDNFTELYSSGGGNANTGNVTFDDITVQGVYGLRLSPSPADTATGKYLQVRAGDNDSHIHFDSGDNSTYDLILGDDFKNVEVNHNGNVYIQSNSGSQWTFNTDGDTVLPDNGGLVFDRNNTSIRVGMGFHIASGEGISLDAIDQTDPENLVYKNWYFSPDGNMFLPNPGVIKNTEGSVNIVAPDYAQLQWTTPTGVTEADPNGTSELKNWIYVESGGIIAETNLNGPGIPFSWSFNTDGSVSIPYQSSNNRTGNGDVLMFAKHNAQQKIIGTQSGTVDYPTVERLVIAGGDSYTDGATYIGEGGDIYLWAGYGADGGDIKVDAGNGVNSGGSVKVRGGNSVEGGNGGFVEILSGYSSTGDGGNVTITASNAYANGGSVHINSGTGNTSNGNVTISTPGNTWTFGNDAKLTLPVGGDIVDSTGTSVLGGGSGGSADSLVNGSHTVSLENNGDLIVPSGIDSAHVGTMTGSKYSRLFLGSEQPVNAQYWINSFGNAPVSPDENGSSGAVVYDSQNNLIVCGARLNGNEYAGVLTKYSPTGDLLWAISRTSSMAENTYFESVDVDSSDNIYVVASNWETGNTSVHKFNSSGVEQRVTTLTSTGSGWDIAVTPDGYTYVATDNIALIKLDQGGQILWQYNTTETSSGWVVDLDSTGNVYIGSENGKITKFNSDGTPIWYVQMDNWDGVMGLAIDTSFNVYASDKYGLICKLNSSGDLLWQKDLASVYPNYTTTITSLGSAIDWVASIQLDSNMNLYIAATFGMTYGFSLIKLSPDGIIQSSNVISSNNYVGVWWAYGHKELAVSNSTLAISGYTYNKPTGEQPNPAAWMDTTNMVTIQLPLVELDSLDNYIAGESPGIYYISKSSDLRAADTTYNKFQSVPANVSASSTITNETYTIEDISTVANNKMPFNKSAKTVLSAGAMTWHFNSNGTMIIPPYGNIKDCYGNTLVEPITWAGGGAVATSLINGNHNLVLNSSGIIHAQNISKINLTYANLLSVGDITMQGAIRDSQNNNKARHIDRVAYTAAVTDSAVSGGVGISNISFRFDAGKVQIKAGIPEPSCKWTGTLTTNAGTITGFGSGGTVTISNIWTDLNPNNAYHDDGDTINATVYIGGDLFRITVMCAHSNNSTPISSSLFVEKLTVNRGQDWEFGTEL